MPSVRSLTPVLCAIASLAVTGARAQVPFRDSMVQPTQLQPPQRGSLAGQYARVAFGPAELTRGGFSLPGALTIPVERGAPGVDVFPVYSPDSGISEWGMGWQSTMALTRWRAVGDLDYRTDELTGPWGRLVQGTDGAWYPQGLQKLVRVDNGLGNTLTATLPDGSRWTFGGAARVDTSAGTYSWYLTDVVTATGRQTHLTWTSNGAGRLFLAQMQFGGTGSNYQYQIDFTYELLPQPFVDYRSGAGATLDRRIKSVSSKVLAAGALTERWRHALTYQNDAVGPAFYLTQVQQTLASGSSAPPVQYGYSASSSRFATAIFRAVPQLDASIAQFGADLFQPNRAAHLDVDLDGRTDLEHAASFTLLQQQDAGYAATPLPPAPPDALAICRPSPSNSNPPRTLTQLRASDDAYQVVSLLASGGGTALTVCNRLGQQLYATQLPAGWVLGPNTRLVDLNRDFQPDLVRLYPGGYQVVPNQSNAAAYSFGAVRSGALAPAVTPVASWAHDFNGDGLVDLIGRTDTALLVWSGLGNFLFNQQAKIYQLYSSSGGLITGLSSYEFTFVDGNKDGLTDLILSRNGQLTLFVNTGSRFVQTALPGLSFADPSSTRAVVGDFVGSGDTEIAVVKGGHAWSLALAGADTSLMTSADDGRGNVIALTYARSPAVQGTRQRQAVLSALSVQTSGHDAVTYAYGYQSPTLHGLGRFLVGFGTVTKQGAALEVSASFLNGDFFAGLPASSLQHDVNSPQADEIEQRTYEDALYQGIPWKRSKAVVRGWQSPDGQQVASERTDYDAFDAEVCPSRTRHTAASGTLITVDTRAQIASFGTALHCLSGRIDISGMHADPSLDFSYTGIVGRNSAGQITQVQSQAPSGTLTLQTVAYNPDFTIASISSPGTGTESYVYDPGSLILNEVHGADGVVAHVTDRYVLTDAVRTLQVDRGGAAYRQFFRYDGLERLAKQWNDLGSASELNPNELLSYRFATGSRLATVFSSRLVDATAGASRTAVDYLTAAGEPVGNGTNVPQGWAFGPMTERLLTTRDANTYLRATAPAGTDPLSMDYGALLSGAARISQERTASNNVQASSSVQFHDGVQRQLVTTVAVDRGQLIQTTTENGALSTVSTLDAARRRIAFRDEAGVSYSYAYDALGRLRQVLLPDGLWHSVSYEGHGRPARIVRDGIAIVDIVYDGVSGLPITKTFSTPGGLPRRRVDRTYDAIGRVTREQHLDVPSGSAKSYVSYYDGATPSDPTARTTPGLLTAVTGDGYTKLLEYRVDGKLTKRTVDVASWRTVETTIGYVESDVVGSRTVRVRDPLGAQIAFHDWRYGFDAFGRLANVTLNGVMLATHAYDANGLLTSTTFANSDVLTLTYDEATRRQVGSSQTTSLASTSTVQRMNVRGLLDHEDFQVGRIALSRQYGYSPQRFLTSATDPLRVYQYGFDGSGLPSWIENDGSRNDFVSSGNTLTIGNLVIRFDDEGRTVARGDLTLVYGADGQIATAQRASSTWSFIYDESGERRAKLSAGTPVAAYLDEGYLDSAGLAEPLSAGGRVVGLVRNGTYESIGTDLRGTVLGERDGTARLSSPFGDRDVHPAAAAAVDYVEKGFDTDLGVVRMGVRDYDPEIARFWTPDPLVLERPTICLDGRVDCNLYGYARDNPLQYTDVTGKCSQPAGLSQGQVGFCVDAFISTPFVPGSPPVAMGLGDNRGFAPNDPAATFRVQIQGIVDFERRNLVSVTALPGVSEVKLLSTMTMGILTPGPLTVSRIGSAPFTVSADFDKSGVAKLQFQFEGINGFHDFPRAPKGIILFDANWNIDRSGNVTWGPDDVHHSAYPSFGMYSYAFGPDGKLLIRTLREFKETTIDQLSKKGITQPPRSGD